MATTKREIRLTRSQAALVHIANEDYQAAVQQATVLKERRLKIVLSDIEEVEGNVSFDIREDGVYVIFEGQAPQLEK